MTAMAWAVLAASVLSVAGTELKQDGKTLFHASARVTFGATYETHAVRATLVCPADAQVTVHVGRPPKNLFLNEERLDAAKWTFDPKTECVELAIPAGTSKLQIRFDDVLSVKPFPIKLPVTLCDADWKPLRPVGEAVGECSRETLAASTAWDGAEGVYELRGMMGGKPVADKTLSVTARGGMPCGQGNAYLLTKGQTMDVKGRAPGAKLPLDSVQLRLVNRLAPVMRVPKDKLDWEGSIVLEGEAFSAEGGGTIRKSTAHGNTHAGGCVFSWALPGHWLSWEFDVPADADFFLTVITASQEPLVLRGAELDGQSLKDAALIRFDGTGGWGRSNADEWQPFRLLDGEGKPLRIRIAKGNHALKLTNMVGQHMNVDCILLTPAK
ncbi:MAG: hypothetical protein KAI66_14515 [Lentisphaeria bacterium]|nr:hypothetical protein [Lentisphaeria bacterium]